MRCHDMIKGLTAADYKSPCFEPEMALILHLTVNGFSFSSDCSELRQ